MTKTYWTRGSALWSLVVLSAFLPSTLLAAADPIRMISANGAGVTFEVLTDEAKLQPVADDEGGFVSVEIAGFTRGGKALEPGLPERLVWIGIPEGVGIEVSSLQMETQELQGVRVLPLIPKQEPEAETGPGQISNTKTSSLSLETISRTTTSPEYLRSSLGDQVAELAYITGMRSQRVAAVRVRPALYDGVDGRLRVIRRFMVQVNFTGIADSADPPPAEPAFEGIYKDLILNYESAKSFRRRMGSDGVQRAFRTGAAAAGPIGFHQALNWIQTRVQTRGIQRVTGQSIADAGVPLDLIDPRDLRVFTRPGVPLLEEYSFCDTCGLKELAIHVVGESDGRMDAGDFILFYGLPPSGWRDEYLGPESGDSTWLDHPYETKNSYWITWNAALPTAPLRWSTRDVSPTQPGAWQAPHFTARRHFEENRVYQPGMYEPDFFWDQWAWERITDRLSAQIFKVNTPGAVTTEPFRFHARFWGLSFEIGGSGTPDHILNLRFNNQDLDQQTWESSNRKDVDSTFATGIIDGENTLRVEVPLISDPSNPGRGDEQVLLYWELHYKRRFEPALDIADFSSPDTIGIVQYAVAPFTTTGLSTMQLLDVSDPNIPVLLTGWSNRDTVGGRALYFHDNVTEPRFYYGSPANRYRTPSLEHVAIRNIQAPAPGADYLIITYDDFEPQAQTLANHRRQFLPGFTSPTAEVIRISDILNWYAGGRMDPVAIRNYLYDIVTNNRWAKAPSYICFLGDASYDFKNIFGFAPAGEQTALVPTFVHSFEARQFLTDDWLVDIDLGKVDPIPPGVIGGQPNDMPDFFVGRLPAATTAEAIELVEEKVIPYDRNPTFGEWRNRTLMVADDLRQGFNPDPLGGVHMQQSEEISLEHIDRVFDQPKVYLIRYPFGVGAEKPLANADIIKAVNDGVLLWNYIGHGNPFQMADENAFTVSNVPQLTNSDRLTICIAASCDLGKFDDPTVLGMGEALVKFPGGGSIATFSASEIAFSGSNQQLNTAFFDGLFGKPEEGFPNTLGQAIYQAKYRSIPRTNDRKYTLQGDPATRLGYPELDVRMTAYDDETGEALVDSLPRGRRVRLEAEVHGSRDPGTSDLRTDFNGTALIRITDSAPVDSFPLFTSVDYYVYNPGNIYLGESRVEAGRATARFYVPLEANMGSLAKSRIYVQGGGTDGSGILPQEVFPQNNVTAPIDTTGPNITLKFARGTDTVPPGSELIITIEDEHGVNITGKTAPNRIVLSIDDDIREDITSEFRYLANSYQRGTISYFLPDLENGHHQVRVTATDNFAQGILARNNRGEGSLDFTVSQAADETVARAYNFPNPFSPDVGTQIILTGVGARSDVEVKVYTVSGQLVRVLKGSGGPGQVQIGWDGTDVAGLEVSNGVYLYRAQVRPQAGGVTEHLEGQMAAFR